MEEKFWKKCSSCKKPIVFNSKYFICSVSTCTGLRTGYSFCSVECWDAHVPGARHRDAGALERTSPSSATASAAAATQGGSASATESRRIIVSSPPPSALVNKSASSKQNLPKDILIVASKLKDYIRARSDMNTSANVLEALSEYVRFRCDEAIEKARADGRKTVLDRDFRK